MRGEKDGIWNYWYDSTTSTLGNHIFGNHVLEKQGEYVDGKKEGLWKYWYNDNSHSLKEEGAYYRDRRSCMWTSWYPINNNNISIIKETGNCIYDKELIKFNKKQNIHDDIKNGLWTQYDKYGNVISHEIYHYGQLWKHTDV